MERQRTIAVAIAALFLAGAAAPAIAEAADGTKSKTRSVQRSKGADGAVDATHTGPKGGKTAVKSQQGRGRAHGPDGHRSQGPHRDH